MASAGHAQAHSSQPMHFSSPSGHRLSWWWPWNRGAVGRLSSGYMTVSTFLNISWKVTPKPLTGLSQLSTCDLLSGGVCMADTSVEGGLRIDTDAVVVRQVERGNRECRGRRRGAGLGIIGLAGDLVPRRTLLGRAFPHHGQGHDEQDDDAEDHVGGLAVRVEPPRAHGGDQQDPDDGDRDEDLPADRHELVVPDPGQRAAEPDEAEEQ